MADKGRCMSTTSEVNAPTMNASIEHKDNDSPAMDIPPEILLKVVRMVITDEEQVLEYTTDEAPPPFPLVLSQVCHHWRTILCSEASLWTRLVLGPKSTSIFNVRRYLERSEVFSIKLDIILPGRVPSGKFVDEMANTILPQYFDRFREVRVYHERCGFQMGCPYFRSLGLATFD
jgi:hypothetical protein